MIKSAFSFAAGVVLAFTSGCEAQYTSAPPGTNHTYHYQYNTNPAGSFMKGAWTYAVSGSGNASLLLPNVDGWYAPGPFALGSGTNWLVTTNYTVKRGFTNSAGAELILADFNNGALHQSNSWYFIGDFGEFANGVVYCNSYTNVSTNSPIGLIWTNTFSGITPPTVKTFPILP